MLELVKMALRVTTDAYDSEINNLISAAELDLGIAGVSYENVDDIVTQAITTYCRLHFGRVDDKRFELLKKSYDEQKAQLVTATGYTDWGKVNE